jgi:DNA-binding CsgD family transcriptional regulator
VAKESGEAGGFGRVAVVLTDREETMVDLAHRGWTDSQIAVEMGLTVDAVKFALYRVRNRLGLDNRVMLAVWWVGQRVGEYEN